jgi:hypothetical protein
MPGWTSRTKPSLGKRILLMHCEKHQKTHQTKTQYGKVQERNAVQPKQLTDRVREGVVVLASTREDHTAGRGFGLLELSCCWVSNSNRDDTSQKK